MFAKCSFDCRVNSETSSGPRSRSPPGSSPPGSSPSILPPRSQIIPRTMILISLFRHSMYHQYISSNFVALFLIVLLSRLLFNAIVCTPETILNYLGREVTDK